jgi:aspartokinase
MRDLESFGECTLVKNRAIVSIIGEGMIHQVGMAAGSTPGSGV